ncbi:MAG TPA: calcium-binding protein [Thermoleophilaceae bacterium]|nr:calcium-binding protein [Thermoleophilaceae bacterium]
MTPIRSIFVLAAALGALALPSTAAAVTSCDHGTAGVLVITTSETRDQVILQVGAGNSIQVFDENLVTCSGGAPHTKSVDTVLVVDDSDDPTTPTANDGSMLVSIASPEAFAPGKTAEATGASEIEFLMDTRAGRDRLVLGGPGKQTLVAGSDGAAFNTDGDPEIQGMPFDDLLLFAGAPADYLSAQGGEGTGGALVNAAGVQILGGGGDDFLFGSDTPSGELIAGGPGNDTSVAYGGDDLVYPGEGDDTLQGGAGTDRLSFAGPEGVTVDLADVGVQDTGQGRDSFAQFENVTGSEQADRLSGDPAANVLNGSIGDDVLDGRGGADELRGDAGTDTASYAGHPAAVTVDLARTNQATDADKLAGIESLTGSPFGDTLAGNAVANRIVGGAGADAITAGDGADRVEIRDGERDRATCGAGTDSAVSDRRSQDAVNADCESVDALPEPPRPAQAAGGAGAAGAGAGGSVRADPALSFSLRGAARQRVLRQRGVRVRLRCPQERCTTVTAASASVRVARSTRKLRVRSVRTAVSGGRARTITLGFTRRQLAALRRAVAAGQRPRVRVVATATDSAGNRARRTVGVRVKP